MYNDSEGVSYPLTPSDLIYGQKIAVTPNQRQFDVVSTNQSNEEGQTSKTIAESFYQEMEK